MFDVVSLSFWYEQFLELFNGLIVCACAIVYWNILYNEHSRYGNIELWLYETSKIP
jgi:hypothetical protein